MTSFHSNKAVFYLVLPCIYGIPAYTLKAFVNIFLEQSYNIFGNIFYGGTVSFNVKAFLTAIKNKRLSRSHMYLLRPVPDIFGYVQKYP